MSKAPEPFSIEDITWRQPDGELVSCEEKLLVLHENLDEIRQECQDALEDAVLMGCDEAQVRDVLDKLIRSIENPYPQK
jgi:regulator of replication initiation timing